MKAGRVSFLVSCLFLVLFAAQVHGVDRDYWPTEGWRVSPPAQQGMDPEMLAKIREFAKASLPGLSSILVIRHGYIVHEEYYRGSEVELLELYSQTKSVLSALIGSALQQGFLSGVDQKLLDFYPEFGSPEMVTLVKVICLHHLLTMSSGLGFSTSNPKKIPPELTFPLRFEPGTRFFYNHTDPQMLSMILSRATGLNASDFAGEYLFKFLGIVSWQWEAVFGYSIGAQNLRLCARDLAKIGYLYLNGGLWAGQKLLPAGWVEESTRAWQHTPDPAMDYGYFWWLFRLGGHPVFASWGFSGQIMYVVPDLDLLIVTAGTRDVSYNELVEKLVIPAIRN